MQTRLDQDCLVCIHILECPLVLGCSISQPLWALSLIHCTVALSANLTMSSNGGIRREAISCSIISLLCDLQVTQAVGACFPACQRRLLSAVSLMTREFFLSWTLWMPASGTYMIDANFQYSWLEPTSGTYLTDADFRYIPDWRRLPVHTWSRPTSSTYPTLLGKASETSLTTSTLFGYWVYFSLLGLEQVLLIKIKTVFTVRWGSTWWFLWDAIDRNYHLPG